MQIIREWLKRPAPAHRTALAEARKACARADATLEVLAKRDSQILVLQGCREELDRSGELPEGCPLVDPGLDVEGTYRIVDGMNDSSKRLRSVDMPAAPPTDIGPERTPFPPRPNKETP